MFSTDPSSENSFADTASESLWDACTPEQRAVALGQLAAGLCATQAAICAIAASADRNSDYSIDGATDMASWLVGRYGLDRHTSREWVRVGRALESLPAIADTFGEGRLSFDQVRPLTKIATVDTDCELADDSVGYSVAHLERLARRARRISDREVVDAHKKRSLRWRWNHDRSTLDIRGCLDAADGATVIAGIERVAEQIPPDDNGVFEPFDARCADALTELASQTLADDTDADRATVVIHTDLALLCDGTADDPCGVAEVDFGPIVHPDTARFLACDSRVQFCVDGPDGNPVGVGRTARTVPAWLARLVKHRDQHCRFPGCSRRRLAHMHHVKFWTRDQGDTDLQNLAWLCRFHHGLVHQPGWSVTGNANGELTFTKPDRTVITTVPPKLRPDIHERLAKVFPFEPATPTPTRHNSGRADQRARQHETTETNEPRRARERGERLPPTGTDPPDGS